MTEYDLATELAEPIMEETTDEEQASLSEAAVRLGYENLTRALIEKELTITTMESATSGQIASLITDTEGSSAIIKGAFVTYSNEAKIKQGVPKEIIESYGVYSSETACAMAKAAREAYHAHISIGVTGTMGNVDPANHDSVPGQVYFAIELCKKNRGLVENDQPQVYSFYRELPPQPTRLSYKLLVAWEILSELMNLI